MHMRLGYIHYLNIFDIILYIIYTCILICIILSSYYEIPPKYQKLGSISNFGKFQIGQFDF